MGNTSQCCARPATDTNEVEANRRDPAVGASKLPTPDMAPKQAPKVEAPSAAKTAVAEVSLGPSGEYEISLDKRSGTRLGIDVDHQDGTTLLIESVYGGLVERWNDTNPNSKVKQGDRIIEVNGIRGEVFQLADECKKNQVLNIKIKRGAGA
eukprot:gnl/TRDRNA2_/TRDRNA2_30909_c0_seq1.p1 gnl/TRDRNA2_/TRDRNA2_30909_c0~~gnl/TRDRNA2_/TRDRNA2_30909_c0_seq1.p1  ORF type:complete len:152 (+),score=32.01 gnl/TRDRNA2_/TRDRNA2_30909_c0_seq1:135-590(+)